MAVKGAFDAFCEVFSGKEGYCFSSGQIKNETYEFLQKNGSSLKKTSIIPSDYCYNLFNDGIAHVFPKYCLFEQVKRGEYRYRGPEYLDPVIVMHYPKGGKGYVYGTLVNKKLTDFPEFRITTKSFTAAEHERNSITDFLDRGKFKGAEREAIVKTRVGQGKFRQLLLELWDGKCSVTGCSCGKVLIASHIKPWSESTDTEKVYPFNGLLLTPNLDKLFDRNLISFDQNGWIMISNGIDDENLIHLGISRDMRLREVEPKREQYLAYHREHME